MKYQDIPKRDLIQIAYNAHMHLELEKAKNQLTKLELNYQKKMCWFMFYLGMEIAVSVFIIWTGFYVLLPSFIAVFSALVFMGYRANKAFNEVYKNAKQNLGKKWMDKL